MSKIVQNLQTYKFKTHCQLYQRIGHRTILLNQKILVFGGINFHNDFVTSILTIDSQSYEVSQINTKNSLPIQGFSIAFYLNKIYLWGGRRPSGISDQLWKFQDNLFTKIPQKGQIPKPRYYQSSVIFANQYLIIYGGMNDFQTFNDWYALNLDTFAWNKIKTNIQLPYNSQPKFVWLDTRGILMISSYFNNEKDIIQKSFKFYEFKFRKKENNINVLLQQLQIQFIKPISYRQNPTICKYYNECLYLAIIGGQNFNEESTQQIHSDTWFLNLQTLQCKKAQNIKLLTKYGSEAVFYKDRILLIGGITASNQFTSNLQVIDLKLKQISIDRKLCKTCQVIFGLQDYSKSKLSIKVEYQSKITSYIPAKLVEKFSQFIQNPIKAIGLLIDNSMNMNASMIQIKIKTIPLNTKIYSKSETYVLQITDNSYGFSKEQIIQSFYTFGYKIESFTHDIKFQEQLAIRKQYGLHLKLSAIKLGKGCLYCTTTIEQEKFICYFSTNPNTCSQTQFGNFNCFHYFLNSNGECSSLNNRHIISKNVEHFVNLDQLQKISQTKTKIFIFDFNKKGQISFSEQISNLKCVQFQDQGQFFIDLHKYLKYLYLRPYCGRTIKVSGKQIFYDSFLNKLKQDQICGKIQKINCSYFQQQVKNFQGISLFKILNQNNFQHSSVLIYSSNRLIDNFIYKNQYICGYVELKNNVGISLGKCGIENYLQRKNIKKYILKLFKYAEEYSSNKKRSLSYDSNINEEQYLLGQPIKRIK